MDGGMGAMSTQADRIEKALIKFGRFICDERFQDKVFWGPIREFEDNVKKRNLPTGKVDRLRRQCVVYLLQGILPDYCFKPGAYLKKHYDKLTSQQRDLYHHLLDKHKQLREWFETSSEYAPL